MALADAAAEVKAIVEARPLTRPEKVTCPVIEAAPASASS